MKGAELSVGARILPGHPAKAGAGYDCMCGGCLSLPERRAEWEAGAVQGDPGCPFCRGDGDCIECDPETAWK